MGTYTITITITITTAAAAAAMPCTSGSDRQGATRQKKVSRTGCAHDDHT